MVWEWGSHPAYYDRGLFYNGWSLVLKMKAWEWGLGMRLRSWEPGISVKKMSMSCQDTIGDWQPLNENKGRVMKPRSYPGNVSRMCNYRWWHNALTQKRYDKTTGAMHSNVHRSRTAKIMTGNWVFMAMLKLPSWLRLILLFCLALNRCRKPSSRPSRLEASDTQK